MIDDTAFLFAAGRFEHLLSPDTFRKFLEIYLQEAKYQPLGCSHEAGSCFGDGAFTCRKCGLPYRRDEQDEVTVAEVGGASPLRPPPTSQQPDDTSHDHNAVYWKTRYVLLKSKTERESGCESELQRVRGFLLMYLDHGKYKDDPDTRKLFEQFARPEVL